MFSKANCKNLRTLQRWILPPPCLAQINGMAPGVYSLSNGRVCCDNGIPVPVRKGKNRNNGTSVAADLWKKQGKQSFPKVWIDKPEVANTDK